jgi:signal transduction histidine kinase
MSLGLREGCKLAALLAMTLFPAFALLDYFTQHERYLLLWEIRFATTAVFAALYLALRAGKLLKRPALTGAALLLLATVSITAMCLAQNGYQSPYYAGINLVVLAAVLIFPWGPVQMARAVVSIIAVYALATLAQARFEIERPDLLINNLYFLLSTGVIGVTGAYFSDRQRRDSFRRAFESEQIKAALELREDFISIASHELKTPISAMKLQLQLAGRKLKASQEQGGATAKLSWEQLLAQLEAQTVRMNRLVDDMLDATRFKTRKMELHPVELDLRGLVRDIVRTMAPKLRSEGVECRVRCDHSVSGRWDPLRIEQVVLNLMTNAIRYGRGRPFEVRLSQEQDCGVIEVRDEGIGIPEDKLAKIFERFERVDPGGKAGGLGLGLYIAHQVVLAHGGSISVQSRLGEGSTFRVKLPLRGTA